MRRTYYIFIPAISLNIAILFDSLTELETDLCNKQTDLNGLNLLHIFMDAFMS